MNKGKSKSALTQCTIQTLIVKINIQKYNCLSFFFHFFSFSFFFSLLQPWQFPKSLIITIHYKYGENRKLGKLGNSHVFPCIKNIFFTLSAGQVIRSRTGGGGGGGSTGINPTPRRSLQAIEILLVHTLHLLFIVFESSIKTWGGGECRACSRTWVTSTVNIIQRDGEHGANYLRVSWSFFS